VTSNWINNALNAALFLIYVVTSCYGLYLIKAAESWRTFSFITGALLYCAGAAMWMVILRLMPLSLAFPVAAGSLVVGTLMVGGLALKETISAWQMVGAAMIVIGISIIATTR
jgi:multidrug transporter EmrE-like cation transporter